MEQPMYLVDGNNSLLGVCRPSEFGWAFLPKVFGRCPSRRHYVTVNECIPRWAFKKSNNLLTAEEWQSLQAKAA